VYNGQDSDKGYFIARALAFDKKFSKSLLLCKSILADAPSHIDTKILTGRINVWQGNYKTSIAILKECIKMNPNYIDSYAALFDVYFWSDRYKEGLELAALAKQNSSSVNEIADKIARAKREARKRGIVLTKKMPQKQAKEIAMIRFEQ
jgi:lipopolysaccharide biosynthesis regulator YciM